MTEQELRQIKKAEDILGDVYWRFKTYGCGSAEWEKLNKVLDDLYELELMGETRDEE